MKKLPTFLLPFLFIGCIILIQGDALARTSKVSHKKSTKTSAPTKQVYSYLKEIKKEKGQIIISRTLANLVKDNNKIVLSEAAVKQKLDEKGHIAGYELVQIDRPGILNKMGFKAGDVVTSINDIPVAQLEEKSRTLESSDTFQIALMRKNRSKKINVGIR